MLPTIRGLIRRRILVNFRVDPDVIRQHLPPPFSPKLLGDTAVAGVCLIRLEQLRPDPVPFAIGLASENAAYRVAVTWTDAADPPREGVYITRRETNSLVNRVFGGRVFPGVHRPARFDVRETAHDIEFSMRSDDGGAIVHLRGHEEPNLPSSSRFASLAEASDFFAAGKVGYSPGTNGRLEGLRLHTAAWRVQPFALDELYASYFADARRFPPGSVEFDCALIMRNVEHDWHPAPDLC